jgi:hypothetical protein
MASCDFLFVVSDKFRNRFVCTHPTPPRPTSAILEARVELLSWIRSSSVSRLTKSGSRANGTVDNGMGGVSGRSRVRSGG